MIVVAGGSGTMLISDDHGLCRVLDFVHRLKQVKEREHKDPNKVNKMPEETSDLHPVREVFRITPIKFRADW